MPRSAAKPAERRRPREAREPPWSAAENGERVDRLQRHGARGAPGSAAERVKHAERRGATQSTWSTAIPQSAAECAERIRKPRSLPECHEVLRSAQIA